MGGYGSSKGGNSVRNLSGKLVPDRSLSGKIAVYLKLPHGLTIDPNRLLAKGDSNVKKVTAPQMPTKFFPFSRRSTQGIGHFKKISKPIDEDPVLDEFLGGIPTGYTTDVAELAHYNPLPYKCVRDDGFLQEFITAYGIDGEDAKELQEYIIFESAKIMREQFNRIIQFFKECNIPKVYILAVMIEGCDKNIVDIAKRLGISKQAVHKHLRRLDPHFSKFGKFYSRQRNFKEKESNGTHK